MCACNSEETTMTLQKTLQQGTINNAWFLQFPHKNTNFVTLFYKIDI